jgi:predicted permease
LLISTASLYPGWRSDIIHQQLNLLASIFANDILPIFAIAGVGFLLARHFDASVETVSKVSFNALSPCLVFYQLVTSNITSAEFGRMALFAYCSRLRWAWPRG